MQLVSILLAAAMQGGATSPQAPPAADPATELPEVTVTCRTQRATGSRVVKKICKSVEQQRQDDRQARAKLRMGTQVQATEVFKRPSGE